METQRRQYTKRGRYSKRTFGTLADRFWPKVSKAAPDECWPWTGATVLGYGVLGDGERTKRVHILSWEICHGEAFPTDKFCCHTCDNPSCVNPSHLYVGTPKDNMQDAVARRRNGRLRRTHCLRGHEYTPENTQYGRSGNRRCVACRRTEREKYA